MTSLFPQLQGCCPAINYVGYFINLIRPLTDKNIELKYTLLHTTMIHFFYICILHIIILYILHIFYIYIHTLHDTFKTISMRSRCKLNVNWLHLNHTEFISMHLSFWCVHEKFGACTKLLMMAANSGCPLLHGLVGCMGVPTPLGLVRHQSGSQRGACPVEMTFCIPLNLPGQFQDPIDLHPSESQFLQDFRQSVAKLRPVPTSAHRMEEILTYPRYYITASLFSSAEASTYPVDPVLRRPVSSHRTPSKVLSPAIRWQRRFGPHWTIETGHGSGQHDTCTAEKEGET